METLSSIISSIPVSLRDVATLIPIVVLVGLLFHYSNKEVKKSLEQSKRTHELLEKELQETKVARLNELARAAEFGRLAQGLFHDLMTPLTSIVLETERLTNAKKAVEASRRMASYIKDMRATLSREDAERICSLRDELDMVLHFLSYEAREKAVTLSVLIRETPSAWGSPTKIRQIFSNIILNAIDSFESITDDRPRKVEISLEERGGEIIFIVQDNGSGIPLEAQDKIFEPFYTTKPHDKGTGIGLTTVKSIVEKYFSGKITLKSIEGEGTLVNISFPRDSRDPDAFHRPRHTVPARG